METEILEYMINHLFLPPQLPQENDWDKSSHTNIIQLLLKCIDRFMIQMTETGGDVLFVWEALRRMVKHMADTRTESSLDEHTLKNAMLHMQPNDVLCLHIIAQNAGVILRESDVGETILFEIFQASPPAAKVTSTIGKLVMTFPSMPRLSFPKNEQCIASFCRVLAWLDRTKINDATAKSKKAGSEVNESREVGNIHYISQMLGGILATATTSNLDDTENTTVYVTKRINDHVLWSSADLPWRRMPEWLILRVALQTTLQMFGIDANSQFGYKSFITYLLATVLNEACSSEISHEVLHVMNVKIAGRMWKLRDTVNSGPVFDFVSEQVKKCGRILQERWDQIQADERSPLRFSPLSVDDINNACHFHFPNCGDYLSRLFNRQSKLNVETQFDPASFEKGLRPKLIRNGGKSPPEPLSGTPESPEFWVAFVDFENWIVHRMQQWQEDVESINQIKILQGYLQYFIKFINPVENPEFFSRLYLVVLELWVALDQAVIQICPLLQKYSPEIEVQSFEPLLLPKLSQMRRLHRVEQYIQERHDARVRHHTSIFNFEADETSFASQYYLTDNHLQNLRDEIRKRANAENEEKVQEWERLQERYQELTDESDSLSHSYYTTRRGRTSHPNSCLKCRLTKKASSLSIQVYEWPLPEDAILERIVVFELSPPEWFIVWRTITYDIAKIKSNSSTYEDGPTVILREYRPLAQYSTADRAGITIASYNAKPWYKTHYSKVSVKQANLESDVIKEHPLRYRLYDPTRKIWITSFHKVSLRDICTPTLPSGVYSNLYWVVSSTTHTSNMVIAKQSDCPRSLTYHEWASFGHLRAGGRLQWRNILTELLKGVGTFKDPAWFILLRQAVWQVEHQGNDEYRDFHIDLIDKSFAMEALEVLSGHFNSICENWQEGWTAMSLAMLTCRIHSLNNDVDVRRTTLELLSRLRQTCSYWLEDVRKSYLREDSDTNPEFKKDLLFRLLQIAVCCRSTYALERGELGALFAEDPNAVKILVTSSIAIQDFLPGSLHDLPFTLKYIIQKDVIQAAEVFTYLMSELERSKDVSGFKNAIKVYWESFSPEPDSWVILHDRWLRCRTLVEKENDQPRYTYYNVLDGQLLIDGKRLGGLPKSILQNPLYRWIFPNRPAVEIVPSTLKGMSYQLAHNVNGTLEVHFEEGEDLIIRIRDNGNNGATSEFVDNTKLRGDFPNKVLHNTVILYCDVTGNKFNSLMFLEKLSADWNAKNTLLWEMEFSGDPLLQSPAPKLTSASGDHRTDPLKKQVVLSPHSLLVRDLFSILNRLETSSVELCILWESNRTCLSHYLTSCLLVTLPRYLLTFFLNSSRRLECKELPNMIIAGTQTVGTLIGLRSQLILEDARYPVNKKILIPYGNVNYNGQTYCAKVFPLVEDNHIRLFVYELDHVLQRLTSTETLASFYYLIYLHTRTSYHMADPLTGRRGTEQALWMLKSNASFAFMEPLKDIEPVILERLRNIAPERHYYPKHLKTMESTTWRTDIPVLAQSDLFVPFVDAILEHNEDLKMFLDDSKPSARSCPDNSLRLRSQVRTSRITTPEFCKEELIDEVDKVYKVPLTNPDLEPSQKRLIPIATSVKCWTPSPGALPNLWSILYNLEPFMAREETLEFSEVDDLFKTSISPNDVWFGLFYECCQTQIKEEHYYDLLFTFSVMAYRSERNMDILRLLLAMAFQAATCGPEFSRVSAKIPYSVNFTPRSEGYEKSKDQLRNLVTFCDFQAGLLSRGSTESDQDYRDRCSRYYHETCKEQQTEFVDLVYPSPLPYPSFPSSQTARFNLIDYWSSRSQIEEKFSSWTRNSLLHTYCSDMNLLFQQITSPTPTENDSLWLPAQLKHFLTTSPRFNIPTLLSLIYGRQPSYPNECLEKTNQISDALTPRDLAQTLRGQAISERLLQLYCDDLLKCIDALEPNEARHNPFLNTLQHMLGPKSPSEELLSNAGLWPVIHPVSLLGQLTYPFRYIHSADWLSILSEFGEALKRCQSKNRQEQLRDSSQNVVGELQQGEQWKSSEYLDWLLLELDSDISIRPVQVNIAKQMMSPTGGTNTVMQLNMGEGKSSVIIPMVSMTLADGEQLVRVMVLKPLSAQMFALLRQRVSGLANRRLYFLPFHRNVRLDASKVQRIFKLFQECAESAGILLCQPEHILSFRLIGLERLCSSNDNESFLNIQRWLDEKSRDLLDESDELLSTRYQLIYTVGTPLPLDGQPHRWEITQRVFSLIHDILAKLPAEYNHGLEVSETIGVPGRLPRLRVLTNERAQGLIMQVAWEIIYEEGLPWLLLRNYTEQHRNDAFDFITSPAIDETKYDELKHAFPHNFPHLLLLRGLLALGILAHVFKEKRWRVDYGLDLSRCLVAVPYRAKDYPSLRAEFGHPEVIIALTCLSYYYGGLRDQEMTRVFEILLQMDNPDLHYQDWIKDQVEIPSHLRTLRGLNLEDAEQQHTIIFPRLRYMKSVIDFYLGHEVFPREAKEFPYKLTTNSWDLAMQKPRVTTGFSGTNDHQYLLPLSIKQHDSPDQKHTNALVLKYVLRPENQQVIKTGTNPSAATLLELVVRLESQILIDAGAQVLELGNAEVAKKWLSLEKRKSIEAAIYCDSKDEVFKVISRTGRVETLQNSPYKTQLEKTVVYLDEARTRGTDLKFPLRSVAVVTLGPKLVKDKLMQACMRMRQLGRGHSVMFFASDEIVQKIQELSPDVAPNSLKSSHVLLWSMHETFLQLKNNIQHWGIQGLNYSKRCEAWRDFSEVGSVEKLSETIMEKEAKTLEELYGLHPDFRVDNSDNFYYHDIVQRSKEYGVDLSTKNNIAEEQERELAHEKEEEREVERASKVEPTKHAVDPTLKDFLSTGRPDIQKFKTLADGLKSTSSISNLKKATSSFFQSSEIRCTRDFILTIQLSSQPERGAMNGFLRPVQWIMTSTFTPNFLCVISPYEANELFPQIRSSNIIQLHCYTSRVSRQGKSTEGLNRFLLAKVERSVTSRWTPIMIQELNIFSGQLFFEDQEAFKLACRMLGLHLESVPSDLEENIKGNIEVTGFVKDVDLRRRLSMTECKFNADPVRFLQDLFSWRCKGQGYSMTHIWKLLHGRNIKSSEF